MAKHLSLLPELVRWAKSRQLRRFTRPVIRPGKGNHLLHESC